MKAFVRPLRLAAALLGALATLAAPETASAAAVLVKSTFSGGALETAGGSYSLSATLGESGVVGDTAGGSYRLTQGFWGGFFRTLATDAPGAPASTAFAYANGLRQNAPNPFATTTDISFGVATRAPTRLEIYDVTGRRVRVLLDDVFEAGRHRVRWDGRDDARVFVASGVYFYRLAVGDWSETRKMLRLR